MSDELDLALLFAAGFVSWAISTLSAGGGSLLILAAVSYVLEGQAVAPVVTLTSFAASPARMIILRRHIDWRVARWYAPGAATGAVLGAWFLSRIGSHWIELLLAGFLISTIWQYRLGARARSFPMRLPWFLPVSFCSGLVSAVIGASGLLVNPFYLNYGLEKEAMLATRAVNSGVIQIIKIASYATFGVLTWPLVRYGLAAGLGAISAVWITNSWLAFLTPRRFRQLAILVMVLGGLTILWKQRDFLGSILGQ
jgi:uncharacterized membrane protein YfcA